jgi:acyl-CoA synthetase (AMP-forming)/AMP-acid ligase II
LIAPRELEEAAQRVNGVRVAAAASVPDRQRDDTIVIAVEADVSSEREGHRIAADVSSEIVAHWASHRGESAFSQGVDPAN